MKKSISLAALLLLSVTVFSFNRLFAQPSLAGLMQRFAKLDSENIKWPYEGIVTSKGKQQGLFSIKSTGVSTKSIKLAGEQFLKSLTKAQLAKTQYDAGSKEWQGWANMDNGLYKRNGISVKKMSQGQTKTGLWPHAKSVECKRVEAEQRHYENGPNFTGIEQRRHAIR